MSMYFVFCKQLHRNNIICDFINLYVLAVTILNTV